MMMKLSIKNQKPLVKVGARGHYTMAQKRELSALADKGVNVELNLKALAAKWNRAYGNVKSQYNKINKENKEIVDKELTKRESKMYKQSVHNVRTKDNAWSEFETEVVMEAMSQTDNKKKTSEELSELLDGRTPAAIISRYHYVLEKQANTYNSGIEVEESLGLNEEDCKHIVEQLESNPNPFFIPEKTTNVFLEEVSVPMYKSLDGSLHEKASDGVKANVRFILDSMPDKDVEDSVMHSWFVDNSDKVNYILNTSVEDLWKNGNK